MLPALAAEDEPVHQCSVDPDVQFLLPSEPASIARIVLLKTYPDSVFAVHREGMADGHAPTGAQGQIVTHPDVLASRVVRSVARRTRPRRRQSDRQSGDRPGDRQVPLHVKRRNAQGVGNIVEPAAHSLVAGQRVNDIDLQPKQVVHGVVVLGTVKPVHRVDATDVRAILPGGVQLRFEPAGHRVVGLFIGTTHTSWRHGPRTQLGGDLLPDLGVGGRIRGVVLVQFKERRTANIVVTTHTVLFDHRLRFGACGDGAGVRVPGLRNLDAGLSRWPHFGGRRGGLECRTREENQPGSRQPHRPLSREQAATHSQTGPARQRQASFLRPIQRHSAPILRNKSEIVYNRVTYEQ